MAKPQQARPERPAPRLTLVTPTVEDPDAFATLLADALAAADIAAVLLRLAPADDRTLVNRVKTLAPVVQGRDVALLFDGEPAIAVRGGADGAHLTGVGALEAAVASLKPARIAGCGGLATRHDAMTAAERGADYVMFGEPDGAQRPSLDAILERVAWWAGVFEVPCVGYAASLDEVRPLAEAGADFVALAPEIWTTTQKASTAVAEAAKRIVSPEAVA
jgi:thiamine-phosphate pyrophosphorylase